MIPKNEMQVKGPSIFDGIDMFTEWEHRFLDYQSISLS